jgi:hypothetical protein
MVDVIPTAAVRPKTLRCSSCRSEPSWESRVSGRPFAHPNSCPGSHPNKQGRDTRIMALSVICVGIDVAKDWLDLWLEPVNLIPAVGAE